MRKYKISNFKVIKRGSKIIIYISENNSVFEPSLKKITGFLLEFLSNYKGKFIDEDELKVGLTRYKLNDRVLREFFEIGLVNDKVRGFTNKTDYIKCLKFNPASLVLVVSKNCNLRCKYCYKSNYIIQHDKSEFMDLKTALKSVDYFFEQQNDEREKKIIFFGGEPLLNFKLIKETVSYVEKKYISKGKNIKFIITTNGTLINKEIASYLIDKKFSICISIDGNEKINNQNRVYKNGRGCYLDSLNGYKCIKDINSEYPVAVRATVTRQTNCLSEIYKHLKNLGFFEVGVAPASIEPDSELKLSDSDLKNMLEEIKKLSEEYFNDISNYVYPKFSNLTNMLSLLHKGDSFSFPCGACLGLVAVDPDGKLYPCHRLSFDKFEIGNLSDGIDERKRELFLERALDCRNEKCSNCDIQYLCSGGCYYESEVTYNNWYYPNIHYCDFMKGVSEIAMELYAKIHDNYPKFLDFLTNECNQL